MEKKRVNGLKLYIGNYELKYIKDYSINWVSEYDTTNQFENYDFTIVSENYRGQRFSANITTSLMKKLETDKLNSALRVRQFNFKDEASDGVVEFNGMVRVDNFQQQAVDVTPTERYYRTSFTVTAVALTGSSGGL